jgi:crotonobetainyl-CoA:carnitine CoA-transferase CaiB-like acyl-CoA transferase
MTWAIHPSNLGTGLPLEGVRVLDFSRVLAGPLCAMIAGDLGADVIKVESPDGDPVRALAPPRFGDDATYYLSVNRHRRNVVADLRNPDDFAAVRALVEVADVVVENYLPNQVAALGIEKLRAANPDAVWVTVTPAASGGPLAALPSFDLLAQAGSGMMGITGSVESGPTKVGAPLADVVTGLYGAIGMLTGLFARATRHPARHFEAPLLESAMSAIINQAQAYLATGINPQRLGNDHPSIVPYGPVTTSDGQLLLAVGTDGQWQKLVDALADDSLANPQWRTNDERVRDRVAVRTALDAIFCTRTTDEWLRVLSTSGVPFAPVYDVAGAFAQEQIVTGDFVTTTDSPAGEMRTMASPLRIDGRRPPVRRGPRRLGEDSEEVFGRD